MIINNMIELKHISDKKGNGLIALQKIPKGTIIDISPVIPFTEKEYKHMRKTRFKNYVFKWEENSSSSAIAFGIGEFLNHSFNPNCDYEKSFTEKIIKFFSIKDVEKGEELTINYKRVSQSKNLWFDVHE